MIAGIIRADCKVESLPDPNGDMVTVEQRLNIHHLLSGVLLMNVPGDVVELGCFEGQTAVQIGKQLLDSGYTDKFHLYDSFGYKYTGSDDVESSLRSNFKRAGVPLPVIHKGDFRETIPGELPEKICFAHIDTGAGQPVQQHKELILHILDSVYPRLSQNGVCLLMDYHDERYQKGSTDPNPGVKLACDEFLADKKEEMIILYGGFYSHAYFRKS
jgi:O-methyltransferase